MTKASKIGNMTREDLQKENLELLKEQFNLRMQKSSGQLAKTHLLKQVRRNIARVKTLLNEKVGK